MTAPTHLCPRCSLGFAVARGKPAPCPRCGGKLERLGGGRSKFGNRWTQAHGRNFQSKAEATRYGELLLLVDAGLIRDLRCQVPFRLEVAGVLVTTYRADFTHVATDTGALTVEDVKSAPTRKLEAYQIKRRLMKAVHGIDIVEIQTKHKGVR